MLVGEVAGVLLGRLERGASVGVRTSHAATGGDSVLGDRVPVAIDGVEVVAPVVGPALGVDAGVQVGTTGALTDGGEAAVGFLPRQPDRVYAGAREAVVLRSEEHTSELQSLMRISYAVFCLKN